MFKPNLKDQFNDKSKQMNFWSVRNSINIHLIIAIFEQKVIIQENSLLQKENDKENK
jgi:hypothetical protein